MIATALENNGATVYIVGRRSSVLKEAAETKSVRTLFFYLSFWLIIYFFFKTFLFFRNGAN
jgi:hypothetical protein